MLVGDFTHWQERPISLKKGLIDRLPLPGQHPHPNPGLGIEKAYPQQPLPVILDLDHRAVRRRRRQAQNRPLINPGMPPNHSVGFPGTQQHSRQSVHGLFQVVINPGNSRGLGPLRQAKSQFGKSPLTQGWFASSLAQGASELWPLEEDLFMTKAAKTTKIKETFSFTAPDALSVMLVGDFTHWQERPISLKKQKGGIWKTTVSLEPGTYHYRFLVDGQWRDDPECTLRVENPYGEKNSVRSVG